MPLPVTQMWPFYRSHDNCGPLVIYTDSSISANHFASRCVAIGGVVSLAT